MAERELSPEQHTAIGMLLDGQSDQAVAKELNVTRQTISHWRRKVPAFQRELHDSIMAVRRSVVARLSAASSTAVDALLEVVNDKKANPTARVTAAKAILELSIGKSAVEPSKPDESGKKEDLRAKARETLRERVAQVRAEDEKAGEGKP